MNVSSTSSSSALSQLLSTSSTSSTADSATDSSAVPDDSSDVSEQAQLRKKLEELAKSDPAKFKQVAQAISDKLAAEAKDASGGKADMLEKVSADFAKAAQTGDVSAIEPRGRGGPGGAGGPHGPPPGPPPSAGGSSSSTDSGSDSSSSSSSDSSSSSSSSASGTQQAGGHHHHHRGVSEYQNAQASQDASSIQSVIESALSSVSEA